MYRDKVIAQEVVKKANEYYGLFDMKCPVSIPHKQLEICG